MSEILLAGCTERPLSAYLRALGVFRLVSEQKDNSARGNWRNGVFVLASSAMTREELVQFFLEEYSPTPIVSPWNGGSGFYPGDQMDGIEAIASSDDQRFTLYRDVIKTVRSWPLIGDKANRASNKNAILWRCRSLLPDACIPWLDAVCVMGSTKPLCWPPILGSGGNDWRLEYSNNFMQRLKKLFLAPPKADTVSWLRASLFGDLASSLQKFSIGQFEPGAAGGVGQGWGPGSQDGCANPWDFVLMLEGVLLFAATAVRRSEHSPQKASVPFTVAASSAGFSSSCVQDGSRGETWMPLWSRPASLRELRHLFREGRATVGRSQSKDGLDFARAAASLGVDRGIDGFVRYGFLQRRGKSFAAVPCDRVDVAMRPEASLLDPVLRLLKNVRKKDCPESIAKAHMRLANAAYACMKQPDTRHFIAVSRALADLDRQPGLPGQASMPCGTLSPQWIARCDDGSPEVRIAAATASLWRDGKLGGFRAHAAPVDPLSTWVWDGSSRQYMPWRGSAVDGMGRLLLHRMLRAAQLQADPWKAGIRIHPSDLLPLLEDRIDRFLLADLLRSFSCVQFSGDAMPSSWRTPLHAGALPYGFALLKIFHNSLHGLASCGLDLNQLHSELRLAHLVVAGRVEEACRDAARRLRIAGGRKLYLPASHAEVAKGIPRHGNLAACLLVPVSARQLFSSQPILRTLAPKEDRHDS